LSFYIQQQITDKIGIKLQKYPVFDFKKKKSHLRSNDGQLYSLSTDITFDKTGNQFKNTIVTLGHNRKTHRTVAIQAVIVFNEFYIFPEPYVS